MNRSNGSVRFLTLRVPDFPQPDLGPQQLRCLSAIMKQLENVGDSFL